MKKIKINILLASLGFTTTSILAALPAAQNLPLIDVPSLSGSLEIGVQGYDLQFIANNGVGDFLSPSFPFTAKNIDPGYEWDWGANIGYIFPGTGNDINLSYFHLGESTSGTVGNSIDFPQTFSIVVAQPGLFIIFGTAVTNSGQAKQKFDLNQVDLTAGQFINIGSHLILHPETGLRFAEIDYDQTLNSTTIASGFAELTTLLPQQTEVPFAIPIATLLHAESNFEGVGPVIGMDAAYYLGYGFGLVSHFDSSILVGDVDSKLNTAVSWNPVVAGSVAAFGVTNIQSFKADSSSHIVPNWNAKLGANYTLLIGNTADSNLTLEIGYQASHYYNAIDILSATGTGVINFALSGGPIPLSTFSITGLNHRTAGFGLQGPYASLTLHL